MRNTVFIFLFFVLGILKAKSQTPDSFLSYILRELQIQLANEYNRELSKNIPNFGEYVSTSTTFYQLPKIGGTKESSFSFDFPKRPCAKKWGPIKRLRCNRKINLLKDANNLVRSIPTTPTNYTPKNAVQGRVLLKVNSILKTINQEILKH